MKSHIWGNFLSFQWVREIKWASGACGLVFGLWASVSWALWLVWTGSFSWSFNSGQVDGHLNRWPHAGLPPSLSKISNFFFVSFLLYKNINYPIK